MINHETVPIKVWADVDIDIAHIVEELNEIPGVRTHSCCQGTLGEGGAEPYPGFVSVSWWSEDAKKAIENKWLLVIDGECHGTVKIGDK